MPGNIFILLILLSSFLSGQPQTSNEGGKPAGLLVNGKVLHGTDTVERSLFFELCPDSLQVQTAHSTEKLKVVGYQCIISLKDSNSVWKLDASQLDKEPHHCSNCCRALVYKELIAKAQPGDLIFFDEIKYEPANTEAPRQFGFVMR